MAAGSIGCHSISALMDAEPYLDVPNGWGGGQHWIGRAPFSPIKHTFVNLGDGTYNHSVALLFVVPLAVVLILPLSCSTMMLLRSPAVKVLIVIINPGTSPNS